jgi:hypothetical protein
LQQIELVKQTKSSTSSQGGKTADKSFFEKNKTLIIAGGIGALVLIVGLIV